MESHDFDTGVVRPKRKNQAHFKQLIAPLPPHPIPKCKADISVLVTLGIDKYLYHLPTYRQQKRVQAIRD